MREDIKNTDERAQDARARLVEKRRADAAKVREKLQAEQHRRQEAAYRIAVQTKSNHDAVIHERFNPFTSTDDPFEREVKNDMIRQGLKARSRNWSPSSPPAAHTFALEEPYA